MLPIQKKLSNSFYSILALPATAMGFALCVQISALSWILSTEYGLAIDEIGLVWASGPLAGLVMQLVVGLISDKAWFWGGRRRPFIIIGGVLAAMMLLCLPNLDVIQKLFGAKSLIPVALCVATTLDLAINLGFNPTRSLITDVTPDGKARTKGYTWMQTVSGTFGVLAYFIGAEMGNYTLIYVGVFIVLAFSIFPTLFISEPKELVSDHDEENKMDVHAETKKAEVNELIKIYFANAFSWIGVQTMFVFMFAYAAQILFNTTENSLLSDIDKNQIGKVIGYSFLILNAVGAFFPALVLEPLTRKFGRITVHSTALLVMSIAYLCIVLFGNTVPILYLCMALAGVGWAAIVSLPFAIMSEKVNKAKMGLFMGIFNMSIVIPQLVVSLIIAQFIQSAENKNLIFEVSAVSLFISFLLWRFVKEKKGGEVMNGE
ncbi:MAG: MFS transporter [Chitinophagales bacterium]|nr:MFS transporter [Chitinophagales bacterium]MBP9189874.1 MFS transporter [Chitinophagales bacterium]MBP9703947.1 MFS transporter [Chitinophagales bacterium]